MSDFNELDEAADKPMKGEMKDLPDGEYTFEVKAATIKKLPPVGVMFSLAMVVADDGPVKGMTVEQPYFLYNNAKGTKPAGLNEMAMKQLKDDLKTASFDVADWKKENDRPFSAELGKAVHVLTGMVVRGKKSTKGEYTNFKLLGRGEGDTKPNPVGAAELEAAVLAAKEDVPF